jgi:Tfp pilus assembly protein PilF
MRAMIGGWRRTCGLLAPFMFVLGVAACGAPQTSPDLVTLGLKAQLSGDLSTATTDYRRAIQLDANNVIAHYDLGTIYDQQGNQTSAIGEYRRALVIEPTFTDAMFNLAVDTASSDPVAAQGLYLNVLSLQPSFAAAWLNVGFILQGEGNVGEARADWAKAVSLAPSLAARLPSPSPPSTASAVETPMTTPTAKL